MINKGGPIELQCMTKASDEYTLLWMKASHKSLHPFFFIFYLHDDYDQYEDDDCVFCV